MKLVSGLFRVRPKQRDIDDLGAATAELQATISEARRLMERPGIVESIRREAAREERYIRGKHDRN